MKKHAFAILGVLTLLGVAAAVYFKGGDVVASLENSVNEPSPLPRNASVAQRAQWAARMFVIISRAIPSLTVEGAILLTAQACYESGFGSVPHLTLGNTRNPWNVTKGSWAGATFFQKNADKDKNGKPIDQTWRVYASLDQAAAEQWKLLSGGKYKQQFVTEYLQRGDLKGFVNALYFAGYFELNPSQYFAELSGVVSQVRTALV